MEKRPGSAEQELVGAQVAKKPQGHLVWILQQGLHWGKLAFMELIPVFLSPLQDEGSSMDFELPAACACCL